MDEFFKYIRSVNKENKCKVKELHDLKMKHNISKPVFDKKWKKFKNNEITLHELIFSEEKE